MVIFLSTSVAFAQDVEIGVAPTLLELKLPTDQKTFGKGIRLGIRTPEGDGPFIQFDGSAFAFSKKLFGSAQAMYGADDDAAGFVSHWGAGVKAEWLPQYTRVAPLAEVGLNILGTDIDNQRIDNLDSFKINLGLMPAGYLNPDNLNLGQFEGMSQNGVDLNLVFTGLNIGIDTRILREYFKQAIRLRDEDAEMFVHLNFNLEKNTIWGIEGKGMTNLSFTSALEFKNESVAVSLGPEFGKTKIKLTHNDLPSRQRTRYFGLTLKVRFLASD